jgi:hypothetical protein
MVSRSRTTVFGVDFNRSPNVVFPAPDGAAM